MASREVIVVDVIRHKGTIERYIFELSESEQAHAQARALASGTDPVNVSLRIACITSEGYILESS